MIVHTCTALLTKSFGFLGRLCINLKNLKKNLKNTWKMCHCVNERKLNSFLKFTFVNYVKWGDVIVKYHPIAWLVFYKFVIVILYRVEKNAKCQRKNRHFWFTKRINSCGFNHYYRYPFSINQNSVFCLPASNLMTCLGEKKCDKEKTG